MSAAQDFESRSAAWRPLRSAAFFAALLLAGACQTPSAPPAAAIPTDSTVPTTSPDAQATRYSIRSDLSDVRFLVYRAGRLATLGHNHVVQPGTIAGEIHLATDFHRSSFSLVIPVAGLHVDDPGSRSVEGQDFATPPDAEAIARTTRNMLGDKVLDAARFPQIDIRSLGLVGPAWAPDVSLRIRLRGVERDMTVPVAIDLQGDRLVVTAVFEIRQTDFGITPLSVLGGALQVADTVRVRMRIVAQKG